MTTTSVAGWSTTAALNVEIDGNNIGEGCPAGNVNNMGRSIMAQAKAKFDSTDLVLATGTIAAAVGTRIYATQALLYADLTPAANLYALVRDDPTPTLNGLYIKVGGTGTGSWSGPSNLFSGAVSALVAPSVTSAAASATSAATSASAAAVSAGSADAAVTTARTIGSAAAASASAAAASASAAAGSASAASASASSAASAEAGTLAAISGATITTSITIAPLTVAALQALTIPADGTTVFLRAPGREGVFTYSTSNHSAHVTADPYQGLYVAPSTATTGTSGAWVRQVEGSTYLASWWGVGAAFGVNNHLPLQSALDLVPPGSTVIAPSETFTTSGGVVLRQVGLRLIGGGVGATEIVHNAATSPYQVIQIARSGCEVAHMMVTGKPSNVNAANTSCIIVSHNATGYTGGLTPITDLKIHDVHCRNSSMPISTFGMPIASTGVSPVSGLDMWNLVLETNSIGIELFTTDNVDMRDFRISYFESVSVHNAGHTVLPGIRILGCHVVRVHDGQVDGYDEYQATHEGLRFSAANSDGTATGRRSNQDCIVERVRFTNFYGAVTVDECRGDCIVRQCSFWRNPAQTTSASAIITNANVTSLGMLQKVGRFVFEDNNIIGWSILITYDSNFGQITVKNNRWIANSVTPDGSNYLIGYSQFGGPLVVEFLNNECITKSGVFWRIATSASNEVVRAIGNTYSEAAGNANVQTPITGGGIVTSGPGVFVTDQNRQYPNGTWAARIAYGDLT